ncbi:hypothetical protein ANANG_G00314400 [Anguilla anguilla]|uniref:Uncharacterized protein n=1 Tax=Anguilla anguilla TaxID=7936 RepID=A0A9D3LIY8_ANGAN|nr:hypothetical protein ANANG_G00314400 [Anguilla anguilla]
MKSAQPCRVCARTLESLHREDRHASPLDLHLSSSPGPRGFTWQHESVATPPSLKEMASDWSSLHCLAWDAAAPLLGI